MRARTAPGPSGLARRHRVALGLGAGDDGEQRYDDDVEAAEMIKEFHDAGLPDDGMIEVARVLGQSMARTAEAMRTMVGEAFSTPATPSATSACATPKPSSSSAR